MTAQEIKTQKALVFMGFTELKEISKSELDLSFKALSYRMNPETCTNEKYKDGAHYQLLLEYYDYLSDLKTTNETIRNILDPEHKTYQYQDEKPQEEVKEEIKEDTIDENLNQQKKPVYNGEMADNMNPQFTEIQVVDKPRIFSLIFSLLFPLFGLFMFIFTRKITPKASKWYLAFGIIGYIINFVLLMIIMMQSSGTIA